MTTVTDTETDTDPTARDVLRAVRDLTERVDAGFAEIEEWQAAHPYTRPRRASRVRRALHWIFDRHYTGSA